LLNLKKAIYFDCSAGASGDMILGSLLDLGVNLDDLNRELDKLPVKGFEVKLSKVNKRGVQANKADVLITEEDSPHRGLSCIKEIINESTLKNSIKDTALKIFTRLAEAEAKIHGTDVDKIHFHEVGAMDAIVDIVGASILIDMLKIEEVHVSAIHTGSGFITCQHGMLPVPAPATLELLKGLPIFSTDVKGELITPTGAAILSALGDSFGKMPLMKVERIGYGAGTKDFPIPNVIRACLGTLQYGRGKDIQEDFEHDSQWVLECNIDDMNNEFVEHVMEELFQKGALDVYITPIQMKKNRPAIKLSVLYKKEDEGGLLPVIFRETTGIGVRIYPVEKVMLKRERRDVQTPWGTVTVKVCLLNGEVVNIAPEYEDCKRIAVQAGIPMKEVYRQALISING